MVRRGESNWAFFQDHEKKGEKGDEWFDGSKPVFGGQLSDEGSSWLASREREAQCDFSQCDFSLPIDVDE